MKIWLLSVVVVLSWSVGSAHGQTPLPFRFVHITDSRVTSTSSLDPLKKLFADIKDMAPQPAFVIETGDVTNSGKAEEFDRFSQAASGLPVTFYAAPGSHDVRWSPTGKEAFTAAFKRLYGSFDYHDCHFVLLDSTMLLQRFGHIENTQLKWLESDLKKLHKETPVFVFVRHWIGIPGANLDNEEELIRILGPANVIAVFFGHCPEEKSWEVNGIHCFMTQKPQVIEVGARQARIMRLTKRTEPAADPTAIIPLEPGPRGHITFGWDDVNLAILTRRTFVAELKLDNKTIHDTSLKAEYSIDSGPFQKMEPDDRSDPRTKRVVEGRYMARFETRPLGNGAHRLLVRLATADNRVFQREEVFSVEQTAGQPKVEWRAEAPEGIQGSPLLSGKLIYAASGDGKLYAFDAANGRRKWAAETKGALSSSPVEANGAIYIGSADHFLYSFDAVSGAPKWRFDAHSPVFAMPAVSNGIVCIGANKIIYGLEEATGKIKWSRPVPGYFQSRAAAADGAFYLGGWDNSLYSLSAETGAVKWVEKMGREKGGTGELDVYYSPAVSSPTVKNGKVYISSGDGGLHCLDAATGKHDWTTYAPEGHDYLGRSSPLVDGGKVYVGGSGENGRGECYAFDAVNGKILWVCETGADNEESSPALSGGMLVIGSLRGKVSWVNSTDGKITYQYALDPGFSFSSLAVTDAGVYMASMNGSVYFISTPKPAGKVGMR